MEYIKFLLLSFVAVVAMSCEPNLDQAREVQRFPEAAYYRGELTQRVGEEQTTLFVHVELHALTEGGYLLSIGEEGTNIQHEPQAILFSRLDGELNQGKVTLVAEDVVGKINLAEHTFTSLNAELTADRAVITLDFGDDKVWTCDIPAEVFYLE